MKPKLFRSKNLDDSSILVIVQILDGWAGRLTWELLVKEIELRLRNTYTRQALSEHVRILNAFQDRKKSLRISPSSMLPKPADKLSPVEVTMLAERLSKVTAENSRIKAENDRLLEQFAIWAYNASSRNITLEILSRPLPAIDREVSKVQAKRPQSKGRR
jgi:hypothetical protein